MGLIVVRVDPGRVIGGCVACDAVFYEGEDRAWARHVDDCSERNREALMAHSLRAQAPALFDPEVSGDVEYGKWISRHRAALIDGRMKM